MKMAMVSVEMMMIKHLNDKLLISSPIMNSVSWGEEAHTL